MRTRKDDGNLHRRRLAREPTLEDRRRLCRARLPRFSIGDGTHRRARSPSEFRKGHIPNAVNVALFEDEERKVVGTLFAKRGRKAAMVKGMDFVREKWEELIEKAQREVDAKKKSRGNNETKKRCGCTCTVGEGACGRCRSDGCSAAVAEEGRGVCAW